MLLYFQTFRAVVHAQFLQNTCKCFGHAKFLGIDNQYLNIWCGCMRREEIILKLCACVSSWSCVRVFVTHTHISSKWLQWRKRTLNLKQQNKYYDNQSIFYLQNITIHDINPMSHEALLTFTIHCLKTNNFEGTAKKTINIENEFWWHIKLSLLEKLMQNMLLEKTEYHYILCK